jgi:hypothetical protein
VLNKEAFQHALGTPDFELPVATRAYRMRLLNGSNSRIYKLAWDEKALFCSIVSVRHHGWILSY